MKNLFLGVVLLGATLSSVACTQKKSVVAPAVTVKIPVADVSSTPSAAMISTPSPLKLFKGAGWQFSVAAGWNDIKTTESGIEALLVGKNKELVIMAKDTCLTDNTSCITSIVQSLKDNGIEVNSVGETFVNNHHFWVIKSTMDDIRVSAWVSIVQGEVIVFSCGGPIDLDVDAVCDKVVETLKITQDD